MTDNLTQAKRSWTMSRIRSKNTKPEMAVRKLFHKMGYRFRLQKTDMPGKPDIVLLKYKTAVFVHGCFWHRHKGCHRCTTPSSNKEYWLQKFKRNKENDRINNKKLKKLGWKVLIIWECETRDLSIVQRKIEQYTLNVNVDSLHQ